MKLTCAARHLCAMPNVTIPIKLPGDKSDTSPSAPGEPKHICKHFRKPMHGGICGQNFKDVHGTLDKTKLHHKDTNEINPIATISAYPMLPRPASDQNHHFSGPSEPRRVKAKGYRR